MVKNNHSAFYDGGDVTYFKVVQLEVVMGYENWPRKLISPLQISLDEKNPRLPSLAEDATQALIREEMLNIGEVRDMIKSIAKSGFFPDQSIVVIRKESGRGYVVVEGNRRVCACQILLKPELSPARNRSFSTRYALVGQQNKVSFEKIPAVIAPDRSAALRLIISRHLNLAPVRGWSRYAQGKFAINSLASGQDIDFIKEETGLSEAEIKKVIQEARIFETFLELDWNDSERTAILENLEKFPIEALSRIIRSPKTAEVLGKVEFDTDGWPVLFWEKDKIPALLKRFMIDAMPALSGHKKARLNSRTANTREDVGDYLKSIPNELRSRGSSAGLNSRDFAERPVDKGDGSRKKQEKPTEKSKHTPKRQDVRKSPALDADMECTGVSNKKISDILEELQIIIPEKEKYATVLLLRSLIEICIVQRIKKVERWKDCLSKTGATGGYLPSFEKVFKYAMEDEATIDEPSLRKALCKFDLRVFFNLVAHNDTHRLTETEARDVCTKMTPLIRWLVANI